VNIEYNVKLSPFDFHPRFIQRSIFGPNQRSFSKIGTKLILQTHQYSFQINTYFAKNPDVLLIVTHTFFLSIAIFVSSFIHRLSINSWSVNTNINKRDGVWEREVSI
jgi:hypothetical protein